MKIPLTSYEMLPMARSEIQEMMSSPLEPLPVLHIASGGRRGGKDGGAVGNDGDVGLVVGRCVVGR